MTIDPATGLTLARTAAEAVKKLYDLTKTIKDRDLKQKLDEVLDEFRDLKQKASELEDQNRELREKLRFKSDEFEFRNPFYYKKTHPDTPLCPKCFSDERVAPMDKPHHDDTRVSRRCLVCDKFIILERGGSQPTSFVRGDSPWS